MAKSALSETVLVGQVVRAHGLRGEVLVEVQSDVSERFAVGRSVLLVSGGEMRRRRIDRSAAHQGRLRLHFEGCDDRDEAERLRGCELRIAEDEVPSAPAGEYYYYQLLDCRCRDAEAGDLGRVSAVLEDGGGYLLEVEGEKLKVLIPFVRSYIEGIDVDQGVIDLLLPPGLLDTCASTS